MILPGTAPAAGVGAVGPPALSKGLMAKTTFMPTAPGEGVQRTMSVNEMFRIAAAFWSEAGSVPFTALAGIVNHVFLAADHF